MSRTVFNSMLTIALGTLLGGCGLSQTISDATSSTAKAVFYKQVKTLHLDFTSRAALNTEGTDMSSASVPTLIRVYQLRDGKAFERASYERLVENDGNALVGDVLDERAVVLKPDQGTQLDVPMADDARFVAVVALFRQPDIQANTWRLTLSRNDLDPDRPRVIELRENQLLLRPLKD